MITVDTTLIAYLLIPGKWTAAAQAAFEKDREWIAPPLWRSEFRNVLAQYLRNEQLTLGDALRLAESAEHLLEAREVAPRSDEVLDLVWESGCTAYDCEFVSVAKRLRSTLVTTDEEVLAAFPNIAVSLEQFVAG